MSELLLLFVLGWAGCAGRAAPVDARGATDANDATQAAMAMAPIASVHRRKCGNCHTRVEPGSLPRATIEAAMIRHRRRAKLTEGQWAELIEFLSHSAPVEPRHTAGLE